MQIANHPFAETRMWTRQRGGMVCLFFYCYKGKGFCYLWLHKSYFDNLYVGIVEGNKIDHPDLLKENRSKMKILLIDSAADLPVKKIKDILNHAIWLIQ